MPDPWIQGHPSRLPRPRGESGRRGVSIASPLPCPQGCCQPRGQDLSIGSFLLLSQPTPGGCCGAAGLAGVSLRCIPALGDPPRSPGGLCNPARRTDFPVVANKLCFPYLSFPCCEREGCFIIIAAILVFLHGFFLFTERGRRKQLIAVLWQRRLVLRSPRCLPGSRGAPQHPRTQGLNLSSWLPDEADASPSRCWEEVTGPILSPWGSSG